MIHNQSAPYPIAILIGRLRLSGVSGINAERIAETVLTEFSDNKVVEEKSILSLIRNELSSLSSDISKAFEILTQYDDLRRSSQNTPPIILILEGASSTGKSMIALEMIFNLGVTRILSTDTIRQVLRSIKDEKETPELFCHTYQAHIHKQVGSESLDPILRGFLAQLEHIDPFVKRGVQKFVNEGTDTLVEGVHIIPGNLQRLSAGIIEVLINPDTNTHEEMFVSKYRSGKLRTVSKDEEIRTREFKAAKMIQEYMVEQAKTKNTHIIPFKDYGIAVASISEIVVKKVEAILDLEK
jgi:2-phosphoglycerate kinase